MAEQNGTSKSKRTVTIREVPLDDWDALERERLKLGMAREPFARLLFHLAVWGAPDLFKRSLRSALGSDEPPIDAALLEETEA